jgi:uncharacterized SAM-binding protein YcdF (DUF218 family)/prolyl-tRNA editing enzyme YbaK/EbsC (Cys-tRNA(Pro) deacylase)
MQPLPLLWNDLQKDVQTAARVAWDYMKFSTIPLQHADAIFILGAEDERVASYAADLYLQGLAPLIIFSGKEGEITKTKGWNMSEAQYFSNICELKGVPRSSMILEEESTNTGENIRYTLALLQTRNIQIKNWIIVQKPYMLRRAFATLLKQGLGYFTRQSVQMTSPPIPIEDYANPSLGLELHLVLKNLCGDLHRIGVYPFMGFQTYSFIPPKVWKSLKFLSAAGFGSRCIRSIPNDLKSPILGFEDDKQPPPTSLEQRVELLEDISYSILHLDLRPTTFIDNDLILDEILSEPEKRVEESIKSSLLRGCILVKTPADYYDKPLEYRAYLLNCSISQLNKTILLETDGTIINDLTAPLLSQKYVGIILPYSTKLKMETLTKLIAPNCRLAINGEKVSGFNHGGITPYGSHTPFPVLVSRQTAQEDYIWLGGGLVDVKLKVFCKQLLSQGGSGVQNYKPLVADVAEARIAGDEE